MFERLIALLLIVAAVLLLGAAQDDGDATREAPEPADSLLETPKAAPEPEPPASTARKGLLPPP